MAEIYNFFGDIWDYLRETYFSIDFGEYRNFDISGYGTTLAQITLGVIIGISLAAIVIFFEQRYLGSPVHALLAAGANDEESAKTLAELGCRQGFLIKRALRRRDSALQKFIRYAGEPEDEVLFDEKDARQRKKPLILTEMIDFSTTRFYIPPALCDRAAIRYKTKGNGLRAMILTILICILGGGLLLRLMPALLRMADNMISWING